MARREVLGDSCIIYLDENDRFHLEDGPATIDRKNNYKSWWFHGMRHRMDGPAIEYGNGDVRWFLNGIECTQEEHARMVKLKVYW